MDEFPLFFQFLRTQEKFLWNLFEIQTFNKHFKIYFCHITPINNFVSTVVNYISNILIIKNGMFFELLKSCLFIIYVEINNINLINFLTLLTGHKHHHKRFIYLFIKNIVLLIIV